MWTVLAVLTLAAIPGCGYLDVPNSPGFYSENNAEPVLFSTEWKVMNVDIEQASGNLDITDICIY
jgi:hypothetical protein